MLLAGRLPYVATTGNITLSLRNPCSELVIFPGVRVDSASAWLWDCGCLLAQEVVLPFPWCKVVVKGWLAVGSPGAGCLPWALGAFPVCAAALWEAALAAALPRAAAAAAAEEIVQAAPGWE